MYGRAAMREPTCRNVIGVIESLHRLDLPDEPWLKLVASNLAPLVDPDDMGQMAMNVFCPDPTSFQPRMVLELGMSDALRGVFRQGAHALPPAYVADGLLSRSWCFNADLEGWSEIPGNADGAMAALGVKDMLTIGACDLDGHAVWFGSFQRERRRQTPE